MRKLASVAIVLFFSLGVGVSQVSADVKVKLTVNPRTTMALMGKSACVRVQFWIAEDPTNRAWDIFWDSPDGLSGGSGKDLTGRLPASATETREPDFIRVFDGLVELAPGNYAIRGILRRKTPDGKVKEFAVTVTDVVVR